MTTIKLRGDTAANLAAVDRVYAERELVLDLTNRNFRVGDGLTAWSGLADWIQGGSGASNLEFIILQDQKPANTHGGTFTSGAWRTRDINTIAYDDTGIVSIANNQFTLPAGKYFGLIFCPAFRVEVHLARLYNISDGVEIAQSMSQYTWGTTGDYTEAIIATMMNHAAPKTFELQHVCSTTRSTYGFGLAGGGNLVGNPEMYTNAIFAKVN